MADPVMYFKGYIMPVSCNQMVDYLFESGAHRNIASLAHATKVSATTLYRILRYKGGYSRTVIKKLTAEYKKHL